MKQGTRTVFLFIGMIMLMISACVLATVPLAPPEMDMKAKNMSAPKDKALVYLYRNQSFGAALKMTVHIDGKYVGQTAGKTYFMRLLSPGKHEIASVTEDVATLVATLVLDAKEGKTYYICQSMEFGGESQLQLVDSETGRQGVNESKLIQEAM